MKAIFAMSLVSALLSLAAVLAFSVITFVPRPGAETFRAIVMILAGIFFVLWLRVAFWAKARRRSETSAPLPPWLKRILLLVSAAYSLGIILGILG